MSSGRLLGKADDSSHANRQYQHPNRRIRVTPLDQSWRIARAGKRTLWDILGSADGDRQLKNWQAAPQVRRSVRPWAARNDDQFTEASDDCCQPS
jgi:hypothetical protein